MVDHKDVRLAAVNQLTLMRFEEYERGNGEEVCPKTNKKEADSTELFMNENGDNNKGQANKHTDHKKQGDPAGIHYLNGLFQRTYFLE